MLEYSKNYVVFIMPILYLSRSFRPFCPNFPPPVNPIWETLLSELKTFRVQTILVLQYKKRKDFKIFHSSAKLIASDSDIEEAFKSMHHSIMTKIKNSASKDWIVIETIVNHSIKIFEGYYKQK